MSSPPPHQRFDADPLLAFSIEPGVAAPPAQPSKSIAQPQVATSPADPSYATELSATRSRIDRLERALEEANTQVSALRSEVATLVGVTADIKKQIGHRHTAVTAPLPRPIVVSRATRFTTAIAGVVIGVSAGVWIWLATPSEPIEMPPSTAIASEQLAQPAPPPPDVTSAAIVPVAAIAPPPSTAARAATSSPAPPTRIGYVGTLSIDSDPPGEVFIDRRAVGRTPLRAANLRAGAHLIWIQRDGYSRFTRVVQVTAGRVSRLVADLEPIPER